MRIKSMMKGMLAVVMAMSMAACSGAPAADQTSSESPSPAQTRKYSSNRAGNNRNRSIYVKLFAFQTLVKGLRP